MSKPVRIRQDLAERIGERAAADRRSFANMVEVLLSAALTERGGAAQEAQVSRADAGTAGTPTSDGADLGSRSLHAPRSVSAAVPPTVHDVPMRQQAANMALRDGRCSADVARGTKCKLCGKVHG